MKNIKQVHVQHFTVQSAFSTQRSGVYRVQIGGQHHCQVQQVHTVHYGASTVECTQKSLSSLLSWGVGVRGMMPWTQVGYCNMHAHNGTRYKSEP